MDSKNYTRESVERYIIWQIAGRRRRLDRDAGQNGGQSVDTTRAQVLRDLPLVA